jgi:hypothetical protein
MAEPEGMAELVHRLFQGAAAKALLVGVGWSRNSEMTQAFPLGWAMPKTKFRSSV